VTIDAEEPESQIGVSEASGPLAPDSYKLLVHYQDSLENPAATSSPVTVTLVSAPPCTPGTYSLSGKEPCTEAPAGYHVETPGATEPSECQPGSYSSTTGMAFCVPAATGYYVPTEGATLELECEAGHFSAVTDSIACLPTLPGYYAPKASMLAIPCEAGTYAGSAESATCSAASPGSFVDMSQATTQTPCPAGFFSSEVRATGCVITPAGTFATGGAASATPCPTGFTSGEGASKCTAVPSEQKSAQQLPGTMAKTPTTQSSGSAGTTQQAKVLVVTVAAAKHSASLRKKRLQRILIRCESEASLLVDVNAVVRTGRRHLSLKAKPLRLKCRAGVATTTTAKFKLTKKAHKLLANHRAKLKLTVRVYEAGALGKAGAVPLASAVLRGRR
jgi:hypothetical protein